MTVHIEPEVVQEPVAYTGIETVAEDPQSGGSYGSGQHHPQDQNEGLQVVGKQGVVRDERDAQGEENRIDPNGHDQNE